MPDSPPLLNYSVRTDPSPLLIQPPNKEGEPKNPARWGTVYVIVTNMTGRTVYWNSIRIQAPVGEEAEHLTANADSMTPLLETKRSLKFSALLDKVTFEAKPAKDDHYEMKPRENFALKVTIEVNKSPGLAMLTVYENASFAKEIPTTPQMTVIGVLKGTSPAPAALATTRDVPRNFRAENSRIDRGTMPVLTWNGPANLAYTIDYPEAKPDKPEDKGEVANGKEPTWSPKVAPVQDTTYTLRATDARDQQNPVEHILTTTVQVRNPYYSNVETNDVAEPTRHLVKTMPTLRWRLDPGNYYVLPHGGHVAVSFKIEDMELTLRNDLWCAVVRVSPELPPERRIDMKLKCQLTKFNPDGEVSPGTDPINWTEKFTAAPGDGVMLYFWKLKEEWVIVNQATQEKQLKRSIDPFPHRDIKGFIDVTYLLSPQKKEKRPDFYVDLTMSGDEVPPRLSLDLPS